MACEDTRLNVYGMLGLEEGDAHVIRNAGGVITDDAIRSLTISQRLLGTRETTLIHRTDCGMLTFTDEEVKGQIQEEVGTKPEFALEVLTDLEEDVRQSSRRIKTSPFIPYKDSVREFIYGVESGRLREVSWLSGAAVVGRTDAKGSRGCHTSSLVEAREVELTAAGSLRPGGARGCWRRHFGNKSASSMQAL
jgi:carbonic anhydrase